MEEILGVKFSCQGVQKRMRLGLGAWKYILDLTQTSSTSEYQS